MAQSAPATVATDFRGFAAQMHNAIKADNKDILREIAAIAASRFFTAHRTLLIFQSLIESVPEPKIKHSLFSPEAIAEEEQHWVGVWGMIVQALAIKRPDLLPRVHPGPHHWPRACNLLAEAAMTEASDKTDVSALAVDPNAEDSVSPQRPVAKPDEATPKTKPASAGGVLPEDSGSGGSGDQGKDPQAEWLTVTQAFKATGLPKWKISRLADSQDLKSNGKTGHERRIDPVSLIDHVLDTDKDMTIRNLHKFIE